MGLGRVDNIRLEIGAKQGENRGPKFVFRGRQVGAFCKIRLGDTGGPFIICPKTRFLRFFVRLRG